MLLWSSQYEPWTLSEQKISIVEFTYKKDQECCGNKIVFVSLHTIHTHTHRYAHVQEIYETKQAHRLDVYNKVVLCAAYCYEYIS